MTLFGCVADTPPAGAARRGERGGGGDQRTLSTGWPAIRMAECACVTTSLRPLSASDDSNAWSSKRKRHSIWFDAASFTVCASVRFASTSASSSETPMRNMPIALSSRSRRCARRRYDRLTSLISLSISLVALIIPPLENFALAFRVMKTFALSGAYWRSCRHVYSLTGRILAKRPLCRYQRSGVCRAGFVCKPCRNFSDRKNARWGRVKPGSVGGEALQSA
ncbi:hypothetical protein BVI2075_610049 [Burkholderia vietnamiensis]|nr:hypothetical protein BVI2075_610049 [Burkholderia vietnamiensis]